MCTIPKVSRPLYAVEIDVVCRQIDVLQPEKTKFKGREGEEETERLQSFYNIRYICITASPSFCADRYRVANSQHEC